jgi:hypothetical protein
MIEYLASHSFVGDLQSCIAWPSGAPGEQPGGAVKQKTCYKQLQYGQKAVERGKADQWW